MKYFYKAGETVMNDWSSNDEKNDDWNFNDLCSVGKNSTVGLVSFRYGINMD